MRYLGGKARLARRIAQTIREHKGERDIYYEPFLGGGWVAELAAPMFRVAVLSDIHADLVAMWQAAAAGWVPPTDTTREEYDAARQSYRAGEPASALRGFIGFARSFGGKWFGGWAKPGPKNSPAASARAVVRCGRAFKDAGALIFCADYANVLQTLGEASPRAVVHADPPYVGTTGYTDTLDHVLFWDYMGRVADAGALVFVSEYQAPPGWSVVWEKVQPVSVGGSGNRTERLYMRGTP